MRWPWTKVQTRSDFIVPSELTDSGNFADTTVTTESSLRLSSVWACVRLLSDTVSTLPLDAFRSGEEIPVPPLLALPAANTSLTEWLYMAMVSLLTRGNAFGLITARSGPRLTPSQVEIVNPDNISANTGPNGEITWRYKGRVIDPADLWHCRAFVSPGSVLGLSPISYAAETVGLSLAVQRFGRSFFQGGATPSGILSVDSPMSEESIELNKEKLKRATHGNREPLIITSNGVGTVKWQPLSIANSESQFIESRKLGVAEVCRIFGVPPEMVAGESGQSLTYATVEGRALDFVRYSLQPWVIRLESAIGRLLPRGQTVRFNLNGLLRGTTLERYRAHEIALKARFMTVDEVRALEDLPPLPAGAPQLQAVEEEAS